MICYLATSNFRLLCCFYRSPYAGVKWTVSVNPTNHLPYGYVGFTTIEHTEQSKGSSVILTIIPLTSVDYILFFVELPCAVEDMWFSNINISIALLFLHKLICGVLKIDCFCALNKSTVILVCLIKQQKCSVQYSPASMELYMREWSPR